MAFSDRGKTQVKTLTTTPIGGGFSSRGKTKATPIKSAAPTDGLLEEAEKVGLGGEAEAIVDTTPKLSYLQRLSKGLGALNPAEALLTGQEEGVGAGVKKYFTGAGKAVASAVVGTDYEGERRTFSDVAEKAGIDNAILKFGIGLAGDILLDPSTYFGGAIAKGIGVAAKGTAGAALKGVGKVAPKVEEGLRF